MDKYLRLGYSCVSMLKNDGGGRRILRPPSVRTKKVKNPTRHAGPAMFIMSFVVDMSGDVYLSGWAGGSFCVCLQ